MIFTQQFELPKKIQGPESYHFLSLVGSFFFYSVQFRDLIHREIPDFSINVARWTGHTLMLQKSSDSNVKMVGMNQTKI